MSRLRIALLPSLKRLLVAGACIFMATSMAPTGAIGQEAGRVDVDQVLLVGDDASQLVAMVSVIDDSGRPVTGLTQFETLIDDIAVSPDSIASAVDEDVGVAVLLLIDVSGSMAGNPIAQAQKAATIFLAELGENDRAAIVPFGSGLPMDAEFSSVAELLLTVSALRAEDKNQGTALYASIIRVLEVPGQTQLSRRALVLLTDGQDSGQLEEEREAALEAAAVANLPVFAIGLGDRADLDFLDSMAVASSGTSYHAPEPKDILHIFEAIGVTLRSQYVITMPLPTSDSTERELTIRVELPEAILSTRATFLTAEFEEGLRNGTPAVSLAAGAAGIAILVGVLVWLVRARRSKQAMHHGSEEEVGIRRRGTEPVRQGYGQGGSLTVLEGPNAGVEVGLSEGALDIGSSVRCGLRLDSSEGTVAGTHARVWLKGGKLMLHHLARRRQTLVGDRPVEWATLDPQDTLRIGPHLISFTSTAAF